MKSCFLKLLLIVHISSTSSDNHVLYQITPHHSIKFWSNFLDTLDLTEYFDAFSQQPTLILVDNYFNVDIKAPRYPMLLRKYVKATLGYRSKSWNFQKLVWINPAMPFLNWTLAPNGFIPKVQCKNSPYLLTAQKLEWVSSKDICVRLDGTNYSFQSKVLNSRIHVSIFFPTNNSEAIHKSHAIDYEERIYFPSYFSYSPMSNFNVMVPSSNPVFYVALSLTCLETNLVLHNNIVDAVHFQMHGGIQMSHSIILHSIVQTKTEKTHLRSKVITPHEHYFICPTCHMEYRYHVEKLPNLSKFINLARLHILGFPRTGSLIKLLQQLILSKLRPTEYAFVRHFYTCENHITANGTRTGIPYTNLEDRMAHAYAHEWGSILKNFSFYDEAGQMCVNHKRVRPISEKREHEAFYLTGIYCSSCESRARSAPLAISDSISALRFVSCGERELPMLPFEQLINVYTKDVWYIFIVTILLLCVLPTLLKKATVTSVQTYFKNLEIILRIFMGQDVSLGTYNSKNLSLQISTVVFAALILTNAYKSDNINKLIAPRVAKPYQTFEELAQNNFTIHSRTSVLYFFSSDDTAPNHTQVVQHQTYVKIGNESIEVISNGIHYGEVVAFIYSKIRDIIAQGHPSHISSTEKKLYKSTSLNDHTYKIVKKLLSIFPNSTTPQQYDPFKRRYLEEEEKFFLGSLTTCKNTAMVLPSSLGKRYARKIIKDRPNVTSYVSFGTETYFKTHLIFTFHGVVPPFIIRRMKNLYAAGVFEWWQRFIGGSDMADVLRNVNYFRPMSIRGNILVVFVVFSVGLLGACCSFIFEQHKFVIERLKKIGLAFITKLEPIIKIIRQKNY